ncbi:MAG TPA: dihydroorotase [Candidatus Omnitrophota bacterium]|nr:dihydroorotase [Candidatus Omnitrophota bacterium]
MKILIKNGRLIDPVSGMDSVGDMLIDKGKVVKLGGKIKEQAAKVIDASGKIVAPGFIDMHTHLREPGREDAETIATGLECAVRGGFTTVCAMPNTRPACQTAGDAKFIIDKAAATGKGHVIPIGAITKDRKGEEITEMAELKEAGCLGVSDDGDSVKDSGVARKAMEYAAMCDLVVIAHCEDKSLAGDGVMHEGYWSTVLGLAPIPAVSETTIVERDIALAEISGARLHIAHVSCGESVEIIRRAKARGVKVTAEVTPHHFTLSDEDLKTYDTNLKVNPPLRAKSDVAAVRKGLKDGTIDVIATDHAPHPENEKQKEFDHAPFGMIGLETALSLAVKSLVETKQLTWPQLIQKLTQNPAGILGLDRGSIKEGPWADIAVIDPEEEWVYRKEDIRSLSRNTPFIGKKMKARVICVIVDGKVVLE